MHDQIENQFELQATQFIIETFENSKEQCEKVIDSLPGIYAIIDFDGQILRGNMPLGRLLGVNHEALLGANISTLFSADNWGKFKGNILNLNIENKSEIEFNIEVVGFDRTSFNYLWHVAPFNPRSFVKSKLLTVIGRDVTELTLVTEQNTRTQMELQTAKIVQNTFFPTPSSTFGKSSIAGQSESATECGGDWWHYESVKDKLYLWIGDVTGHGVPAALVVSAVHAATPFIGEVGMSPAKALTVLNKVVGRTANYQLAMTFLAISIDLNTGECIYSSAGHEPIILLPNEKSKSKRPDLQLLLGNPSTPLGEKTTFPYEENKINLKRGDRLMCYTDGMYGICNPDGVRWDSSVFHRNLVKVVSQFHGAIDLVGGLGTTMSDFRQKTPLDDDATFFVFQF